MFAGIISSTLCGQARERGGNFTEILDELGSGLFAAPCVVLHAGRPDPLQAQFRSINSLNMQHAALRRMYKAALPDGSIYRELPMATHSDIAMLFSSAVVEALDDLEAVVLARQSSQPRSNPLS